ncbi:c-di-GMP-binding flagellar brake protein YcgR, contains PilZNR and PilZ domains [Desulfacinum hydrothermale DSM 13146]|uniref:C-di-GMP-binding flagellar brake protein YcgR, contains PilZNR and PilZ domains n=1 Tax=Desulfacinum hydrothermale DSM 13146 TaxID=1121390 RepID=A0A1W1XFU2_9BACT|nr:PilZ domain-containing protein [Desulfacinum hydrothermale]SMC22809.1 c-di-GMP-binding flagellar brake protein YcgR, contains PilZNR and PilZ domains [Desulfacinum hydrothermale DSM 13146]
MAEQKRSSKEIRPGFSVDIVTRVDFNREVIDARKATVFDVDGELIVVSRPSPDFQEKHVGKKCTVTLVVRDQGGKSRFGVSAYLESLRDRYALREGTTVPAAIMRIVGPVEPFNLRMAFRVRPPITSGIALDVEGNRVNILDISTGGARFLTTMRPLPQFRQRVDVTLHLDDKAHRFKAFVVRLGDPGPGVPQRGAKEVAVQFSGMEKQAKERLARKIIQIERELRAKGLED